MERDSQFVKTGSTIFYVFVDDIATHNYPYFRLGDRVKLATTGTLPTGLAVDTYYYITPIDEYTCKFSLSLADVNDLVYVEFDTATGLGDHQIIDFPVGGSENFYMNEVYGVDIRQGGIPVSVKGHVHTEEETRVSKEEVLNKLLQISNPDHFDVNNNSEFSLKLDSFSIQGVGGSQGISGLQGTQGTQGITGIQGVQGIESKRIFPAGTYSFNYSDDVTGDYPGDTKISFDDIDLTAAVLITVSPFDNLGSPILSILANVSIGDKFFVSDPNNSERFYVYEITGITNIPIDTNDPIEFPEHYQFDISLLASGIETDFTNDTEAILSIGYVGIDGVQGVQGIQGSGTNGAQGTQGIQGITGTQGLTGIQGTNGTQGTQGIQGRQGTTGIQGSTGTQGITGSQGTTGLQGITGIQGNTGIQGSTGSQGTTGSQGITGSQGLTGTQGTQGIQGIQGRQGTTGIQGTTGVQGIQGIQSTQGTQGVQGASGSAYTFTQGTSMPNAVGGFEVGTTFSNQTLDQMWNGLLYPYQYPAFTAFGLTGWVADLECGINFAGGSQTFSWTLSNGGNVNANSVAIRDITNATDLATGLANDGSEAITLTAGTQTTNGATRQWGIRATNSKSQQIGYSYKTTYFWSPIYHGAGAAGLSVALLQQLTKRLGGEVSFNAQFTTSNQKIYICYPASWGDLTQIRDQNLFDVTSSFTKTVQSFTYQAGYYAGSTMNYNVYESNSLSTVTNYTMYFTF